MKKRISRRSAISSVSAAVAGAYIVPAHVLAGGPGIRPSEKLNIACIGLGWPGRKDTDAVAPTNNIVALCDVDDSQQPEFRKKYASARQFQDARRMLDEMDKTIDAVIVATPDHTHAVLVMAAMRRGKHVYCEKPLAHSVHEVREVMKAAKQFNVVTQMGNQGHASNSTRRFCEWIWDGAIGNVHTIHAGARASNSGIDDLAKIQSPPPVPAGLHWDLWLGPAPERAYNPAYHPFKWRGWTPFGDGTICDWCCHVLDPVFLALDLGAPRTVVAEVNDWDPKTQADVFPRGDIVTYEFDAGPKHGPIKLVWHSGSEKMPRPPELAEGLKAVETGAVIYGDKGAIDHGSHGAGGLRLLPDSRAKEYKKPEPSLPRISDQSHEMDWIRAIKEGRKAGSDFSYGGRLTEIGLLGSIAIRVPGKTLEWDADRMEFKNSSEANQLIKASYRAGWSLSL